MEVKYLNYGQKVFEEMKEFIDGTNMSSYTLSIYDIGSRVTIEIACNFEDMLECIVNISNIEHDFPHWIGKNDISESYVVGMNITRGRLVPGKYYRYTKSGFIEL